MSECMILVCRVRHQLPVFSLYLPSLIDKRSGEYLRRLLQSLKEHPTSH
jgi:hypothetical protein